MDLKNKNMIQLYAIDKRLTLDLNTQIDWNRNDGKKYPMQINTNQKGY